MQKKAYRGLDARARKPTGKKKSNRSATVFFHFFISIHLSVFRFGLSNYGFLLVTRFSPGTGLSPFPSFSPFVFSRAGGGRAWAGVSKKIRARFALRHFFQQVDPNVQYDDTSWTLASDVLSSFVRYSVHRFTLDKEILSQHFLTLSSM